ncbi:MAG: hypothetical protein H7235_02165, partial [Bdellovibrionaceae bacterium]|nr:hypothetical protein [Pseudobdellovibrionaceae bacterium]
MKKFVVCGNSISYGLELQRSAIDREDLKAMVTSGLNSDPLAWPGQVEQSIKIPIINISAPASGFHQNLSRCLLYSQNLNANQLKAHHFLIDASMIYQLPLYKGGIAKAPIYFEKDSIQYKFIENLNEGSINSFFWSAVMLLQGIGVEFSFFAAMAPYTHFNDIKQFLGQKSCREEFANFMRHLQWENKCFDVPEELKNYFL